MEATFRWEDTTPDDLAGMFADLDDELGETLQSAAEDIGVRIRGSAQRIVPVDEGRLRGSLTHVVEELAGHMIRVITGSNVEYAPHVALGTVNMSAQPYLRPALEENKDWIIGRVEEAVTSAFSAAGFDVGGALG